MYIYTVTNTTHEKEHLKRRKDMSERKINYTGRILMSYMEPMYTNLNDATYLFLEMYSFVHVAGILPYSVTFSSLFNFI